MLSVLCIHALGAAQPRLTPRIVLPEEGPESGFWLAAPYIAVVRVSAAEWIGPEIEITPDILAVQMVCVDADVENVIQGELPKGPVRFYFFTNKLAANGYHTLLSWLAPDYRYVVFLRKDGGILRTMADVAGLNIPIRSGRHNQILVAQSVPGEHYPGKEIVYLALTPASTYDPGFAAGLMSVNHLYGFAPQGYVLHLLRDLLVHPDESIREWACRTLSVQYNYLDPCASKLSKSKQLEMRQWANIWTRAGVSGERSVIRVLRDDPFSLSGRIEDLDGNLEAFTYDSDPAVKQQACTTLHRIFPSHDFRNCGPPAANRQ